MLMQIALGAFGLVAGLALLLTALPRLGAPGRRASDTLARAPLLDAVVALFTLVPPVTGAILAGWLGAAAAAGAQVVALAAWVIGHEWLYREAAAGPRIVRVINRTVGRWRNHAALWVTVVVLPVFVLIRLAQFTLYPMLVWLLGFPRYRHGEWINCSRQKFEGLVGHDLIWCLYCDWMTGVYSLGAEMLRNVESFWCPIRFYDGKKCENCRLDFPDVDGAGGAHPAWVAPDGSMADVEEVMTQMYGSGRREWFGHPARRAAPPTPVTIDGKPAEQPVGDPTPPP